MSCFSSKIRAIEGRTIGRRLTIVFIHRNVIARSAATRQSADLPSPAFGRNQEFLAPSTPRAQRRAESDLCFPLGGLGVFARDISLLVIPVCIILLGTRTDDGGRTIGPELIADNCSWATHSGRVDTDAFWKQVPDAVPFPDVVEKGPRTSTSAQKNGSNRSSDAAVLVVTPKRVIVSFKTASNQVGANGETTTATRSRDKSTGWSVPGLPLPS